MSPIALKSNTCKPLIGEQHEMTVPLTGSFRDLKEILSELHLTDDDDEDEQLPLEVKERAHMLCSKFLCGAWKSVHVEQLRLTRVRGGMSNMLFMCRLPDCHQPIGAEPDKVLLRVYFNPETESHLVAESVIFTLLSERHLGPKLYGIFNGGRLEEYIPSRPLSCKEIRMPNVIEKVAQRTARIHQLIVPIGKEPDYICEALERWMQQLAATPSGSKEFVFAQQKTWNSSNGVHERGLVPHSITCDDIYNEYNILRECLSYSNSPVLFCHNDLQEGNILLPKSSSGNIRSASVTEETRYLVPAPAPGAPRLVVIDFEYASYNYRAFDFANHFCEWTIDYSNNKPPYYTINRADFPTLDQQLSFFRPYLTALGAPEPFEPEINKIIRETKAFVPVSHFFWGVWALLQVELSPVEFGFAEYGRERLAIYFEQKADLLALKSNSPTTFNMD